MTDVNGFEYLTNGETILNRLEHFTMDEGRMRPTTPGGTAYRYEFDMKDHLGNTRMTLTDANNNGLFDNFAAEVLQADDYYPFGMRITRKLSASDNKYTYNGKEHENEFGLNWYHYGARYYDPAVGRWWAVDPVDELVSPYNYATNDPISIIDPDGNYVIKNNGQMISVVSPFKFQITEQMQNMGGWMNVLATANKYVTGDKSWPVTNQDKSDLIFFGLNKVLGNVLDKVKEKFKIDDMTGKVLDAGVEKGLDETKSVVDKELTVTEFSPSQLRIEFAALFLLVAQDKVTMYGPDKGFVKGDPGQITEQKTTQLMESAIKEVKEKHLFGGDIMDDDVFNWLLNDIWETNRGSTNEN